jgi:hypothetical protein
VVRRIQGSTSVGTSSTQILGPNPGRLALIISAPQPVQDVQTQEDVLAGAVSTAAIGVKASFTVPAGVQATLQSATMVETTGTTVVAALQLVRAATTFNLISFTAAGTYNANLVLQAGDKIQWNVTTAVAASVCDFTIFISQDSPLQRVTVMFGDVATLDGGLDIYPGQAPLYLDATEYAQAITEAICCIGATGTATIGWIEFAR